MTNENQGTDTAPEEPIGEDIIAPWDAEGQEILERAAERISGLASIAITTGDVEEELLIEEVEVLELLAERGRELLLGQTS